MKAKKAIEHITKSIVQELIRVESQDWPPNTVWGFYQPQRPSEPLTQPQDPRDQ